MEKRFWNKGTVSNAISFTLLVLGLAGRIQGWGGYEWLLAAGLFGFAVWIDQLVGGEDAL